MKKAEKIIANVAAASPSAKPKPLDKLSAEELRVLSLEAEIHEIQRNVQAELQARHRQGNQAISAARAEAATQAGARIRATQAQLGELRKKRDLALLDNEKDYQAAAKELERARLQQRRLFEKEFEAEREALEKAQRADNAPVEQACTEKEEQIARDFETAKSNLFSVMTEKLKPLRGELDALKATLAQKATAGIQLASGSEVDPAAAREVVCSAFKEDDAAPAKVA